MTDSDIRREMNTSGDRKILVDFLAARLHERYPGGAWDGPAFREASGFELRRLAEHFAGHPDFDAAWRV